jgi:hypothetical protein
MAQPKVYAPRNRGSAPPEFPFSMIFIRDGVEEAHEFNATPTMGWQDLRGLVPLMVGNSNDEAMGAHAIRVIDSLVRRVLRNDDGTPEKWRPTIVDGHFTAPNGDHTPVDLLPAIEAFDAGSSRRRWMHLMENDDEVTIELEQMVSLMEDLIGAVAERPTQRSAPSSR